MAYITELANDVVLLFINRPKLRAGPLSFLGLGSLQQDFGGTSPIKGASRVLTDDQSVAQIRGHVLQRPGMKARSPRE